MIGPTKINKNPILVSPLSIMNFLNKLYQSTKCPEKLPTTHEQYNNKYN